MNLDSENATAEINGIEDLKAPLLQPLNGVAIDIPPELDDKSKKRRKLKFTIREVKCASCAVTIESVLVNLNGVKSATVSPIEGQAAVEYVPDLVTVSNLHIFSYFSFY